MLSARVIPCLDVRHGRVVKGVRFAGLRDAGDPVERARLYESQGADEIAFLDIAATPTEAATSTETVAAVRAVLSIPLTVGGGVRSLDDAARLLDAGADKVVVNTAAVRRPVLIQELATRFGRQCVVLAVDARTNGVGSWEVVVRSGSETTGLDVLEWVRRGEQTGAGELLLTSFDRDGTREGYDTALLHAVSSRVRIPVIASGGAAHAGHLSQALQAGASAVLAASIFHDGETTVADLKRELAIQGVEVRR